MIGDSPERPLTDAEQRGAEIYRATLLELSHYLSYASPGQATLPDALTKAEPVVLRAADGSPIPIAVHPESVVRWLVADGRPKLSAVQVAEALAFMGAKQATTLRPHGEGDRSVRRRPGWWRLSPEMVKRIKLTRFTPVLTAPVGRVAKQTLRLDERAGMVSAKPFTAAPKIEQMITLLRDFLTNGPPVTLVLSLATLHNAPLIPRRRGRPRNFSPTVAYDVTRVYVHPHALTAHLAEEAGRLNMTPVPLPAIKAGLDKLYRSRSELLRPVGWVRAIDTASTTRVTGWHEVAAALLGVELMITIQAEGEYEHFVRWRDDWQRIKGEKPTTAQMQQFAAHYPARFPS